MNATKALWAIQSGIIPGDPMESLTRQWEYTSVMFEEDATIEKLEDTHWHKLRTEAMAYATELQAPASLNWVKMEWMWL